MGTFCLVALNSVRSYLSSDRTMQLASAERVTPGKQAGASAPMVSRAEKDLQYWNETLERPLDIDLALGRFPAPEPQGAKKIRRLEGLTQPKFQHELPLAVTETDRQVDRDSIPLAFESNSPPLSDLLSALSGMSNRPDRSGAKQAIEALNTGSTEADSIEDILLSNIPTRNGVKAGQGVSGSVPSLDIAPNPTVRADNIPRNLELLTALTAPLDRAVTKIVNSQSSEEDPKPLDVDPKDKKKQALARFVDEIDADRFDPTKVFTLYVGLPRLIKFEKQPQRIQVGDKDLVEGTFLGPDEYSIIGQRLGSSVMNVWFEDDPATPQDESARVHSYLLRVVSNPELRKMLEEKYKEIEVEINRVFPDSRVQLTLVGNKLVLSGECKDVQEATYILNVVRANVLPAHKILPGNSDTEGGPAAKAGEDLEEVSTASGFASGTPGLLNAGLFGQDFIVNLLRVPGEQQVMLRVVVAEVNRSASRTIGMNFAVQNGKNIIFSNSTGGLLNSTLGNNQSTGGLDSIGSGLNNIRASLDNQHVLLSFSALRTLGYARSLAEPNIVALNGQSASFQAGGEFPVPMISGFTAAGLQGVSYIPYGVILQFTPMVTDRDRIRLAVRAVVSTRDVATGAQIAGATVPGQQTRNFSTIVELREGQTLAVAGLIQNNLGGDSDRVPGIGDIPFIGNLTGFSRISNAEQELVILITPELVHPLDTRDGYENLPLPGADIYEPGDLEFYLKGRIESRRSTDYRSPVRTEWDRMAAYRRCEQSYIDGPHGQTVQWRKPSSRFQGGESSPSMRYAVPPAGIDSDNRVPMMPDPPQGESPFVSQEPKASGEEEKNVAAGPIQAKDSLTSRRTGSLSKYSPGIPSNPGKLLLDSSSVRASNPSR